MKFLAYENEVDDLCREAMDSLLEDKITRNFFLNIFLDNFLFSHLMDVAKYSVLLSLEYGIEADKLGSIAKAGLMHDLGKSKLDKDILYKPGRLTDEEFKYVEQHPALGYNMVRDNIEDQLMLDAILSHHEKTDGSGYPKGIKEGDLIIQIITVADIFSALTEVRVYKKAKTASEAFNIMSSMNGLNQDAVTKLKDLVFDEYESYVKSTKAVEYFRRYFERVDRLQHRNDLVKSITGSQPKDEDANIYE